ncbi:MAG: DUF6326 family protein [Pseudomonadota bacterium]
MNHAIPQERASTRTVLSTLWIFVLLNLFAKDIHELGRPGMLQQIMTGVVDGVTITEELMLLGGVMFEIPILMVLLSQILPYRINRRANIGAGAVTIMIEVYSNLNPDLDNVFFLVIKILALLGVIRVAWKWKGGAEPSLA